MNRHDVRPERHAPAGQPRSCPPGTNGPHVLLLPSWYPAFEGDSNGIFFREQAMALAAAGMRVGVIAPQRLSLRNIAKARAALTPAVGIVEMLERYIGPPRLPLLDARIWQGIARRLYRRYVEQFGEPDIVHAHSLLGAGDVALSLKASVHVVTEHCTLFVEPGASELMAGRQAYLPRFAARIAVGEPLRDQMERLAPAGGPWIYVPNLIHTDYFTPDGSRPSPAVRVLTVCNLLPRKRVHALIQAFDSAFRDADAELVIAGAGSEYAALRSLAASLPSGPRITFLGPLTREQVRGEMRRCSFFALASAAETFGVVLIEAMSCGKPVVSTASGGPSSIVDPGNGVLVPVDDTPALADALARMARDLATYDAAAIREHCVRNFSAAAVTVRLRNIYLDALGARAA